LGTSFWSKPSL